MGNGCLEREGKPAGLGAISGGFQLVVMVAGRREPAHRPLVHSDAAGSLSFGLY